MVDVVTTSKQRGDTAPEVPAFHDQMDQGRYLRLVTFDEDDTPVATPVCYVLWRGSVLVWTPVNSAKVARILARPLVRISTCDRTGAPTSREVFGHAALRSTSTSRSRLMSAKYGWEKQIIDWYLRLRGWLSDGTKAQLACIAIEFS